MRCSEIIEQLEQLAPVTYACGWDNPGLLVGRRGREVRRIMIALDATDDVIRQAVEEEADMLLTHHPLIFAPLKQINDSDFVAERVMELIRHDITCYAMHTNFDSAPGGMADLAAERMGLTDTRPLETMGMTPDGISYGIGKVGNLPTTMDLKELGVYVKQRFSLPFVTVYGPVGDFKEWESAISRVAVCPGSGKHMTGFAKAMGAQVLITGDMGHHDGIDAVAEGVMILDGGHYGLEHIFVDFMDTYIREHIGGQVTTVKAPLRFPAVVL